MKEIDSPGEFMEIVNAFRISRIILTAHEMNLFTLLKDGALSSSVMAKAIGANERATDRLMNALVPIGLLKKSGSQFSNTDFSTRFMIKGQPAYMGNLDHVVHLWKTWSTLTEAVKAGTSVAIKQPISGRDDSWLEAFIAAMHSRAIHQAKEIAAVLDLSQTKNVLDIGGGSGAFTFEFIRENPAIRGTIFDLPNVIPITRKYITREGFSDSVSTIAGDYLKDEFGFSYDLILLSAVLHINSPEENKILLNKCAESMNHEGQIVILDHVMSDDRTMPAAGAFFALNMLVGTEKGDTYTENEIKSWLQSSGFKYIRRRDTPQGSSMMIGIK
jgi:2-polyprenyl-3-methyl-5-hydroxy-6-metoxy-1,4-benzoquinol methylase